MGHSLFFFRVLTHKKNFDNSDCDSSSEHHIQKNSLYSLSSPSALHSALFTLLNKTNSHLQNPFFVSNNPFTQDSVFFLTPFSTCWKFQCWNRFITSRDLGGFVLFHIKFSYSLTPPTLFFLFFLLIHPFIVPLALNFPHELQFI